MTTNKQEVNRYDYGYTDDGCGGGRYLGLIPRHNGKLVRYKDYEALQAECDGLRKDLEEAEARGAELSAGACHGGYGDDYGNHRCHYQNRIDHLSAMLRHAYPIIRAHAGASHMLDGFRPKRNQWDELVEAIDAAIQEDRQ
ncbi:hypothetical protein [Halopseudomonas bauzanensis]|uniref:hypothetical protein n=1 Tax=Halopseudomonas bauzanensis TaxID=653930 RepID=UPI0025568D3E|nr:hypothetical protein [Halopseudomonas bauzanensis]